MSAKYFHVRALCAVKRLSHPRFSNACVSPIARPENARQNVNLKSLVCRHGRHSSNLTSPSPPLRRARFRRIFRIGAFSIFFTSAGFLIATAPAIASIVALMSSPSDSETLKLFRAPDETTAEIDEHINNHPISLKLRGKPEWIESRPHLKYLEPSRKHSLTAGTLMGPGRFDVPPIVFCDEQKLVSLAHVGGDMCGHVGMIHGGLLSIMLDEGLARCAFNSLPNKIGFTANLNVNFRNPSPANSYLLLTAETIKAEGRKCWVKGRIELLGDDEKPGQLLVEAEALYVEPKYAKSIPRLVH